MLVIAGGTVFPRQMGQADTATEFHAPKLSFSPKAPTPSLMFSLLLDVTQDDGCTTYLKGQEEVEDLLVRLRDCDPVSLKTDRLTNH